MSSATAPAKRIAVARTIPRLGDCTGGRGNNIQLLRMLAACSVVVFHCYALTDHWTDEPLYRLAPELNLGSLGVKIFFVMSGFLVTQSWLGYPQLRAFVVARALRIYPALIAATLFTMGLAAWSSSLSLWNFLHEPQTLEYLWRTASGFEVRDRLPDAFARNPFPYAVNGSLWTLPIELRLYVALALAGFVGLLARRAWWLIALVVLGLAIAFLPFAAALWLRAGATPGVVSELVLLFALGSLAYAWRDFLPLSLAAGLVALLLVLWNPLGLARGALFQPLLAYVVLVAAYHPALRFGAFNRVGDYSYGMYVYSFPLQQSLVERLPGIAPMALLALALPLALSVAALSWHALERPALGIKSRLRPIATSRR